MTRTVNYPAHLDLYAPWPVVGECDWLGSCTEPAADGGKCAGHGAYIAGLKASAKQAWKLAGVTL